jgi:hypothetical protein
VIEVVGTYATRSGSLVEVGVRPGAVGPLRRQRGFQVAVRERAGGAARWLRCEEAPSREEARSLAEARVLGRGGVLGSAAGLVCAPLERDASREMFAGELGRYLHVGAARQGR